MDSTETPATSRWRRKAAAIGLAAAGALAGGVLASTLSASAADAPSGAPAASGYGANPPGQGQGAKMPGGPGHGSMGAAPVRPDETQLTGSDAAKAKAAARGAVPDGTVYRVETDAGDAAYEAHMTTSDGTPVTVKMDKNFSVTAVEDGMGKGDPMPGSTSSN